MQDQPLYSPYFLDSAKPDGAYGLAVDDGWHEIRLDLPDGAPIARMGLLYDRLAAETASTIVAGQRPVIYAGDCCATIGVLAGLQRAGQQPTLIWFDAHGDFNTWQTTPSGFLGGMPLAMAVGLGEQTLLELTSMHPCPESKVVLTDARDLDPGERDNVHNSAITHLPRIEQMLEPGAIPGGLLYVHFDVDVIDPAEAPAMGYPAPGGPTAAELSAVFAALAATGRVMAVSVSLWEPTKDAGGETRRVALETLGALLG